MKKRIFVSLCTVGIVTVLLTFTLTLGIFYRFLIRQARIDLKNQAAFIATMLEPSYDMKDLNNMKKGTDNIRITLIEKDGTVLFDTNADVTILENHINRPEIIEAREKGQGSSFRESHSLRGNTYYHAIRLSDGKILRVSEQSESMLLAVVREIPTFSGLALIIFILCLIFATALTKRLIRPIEKLSENLEEGGKDSCYDEISPFIYKIRCQNEEIKEQVEKVKKERDTIRLITDNMKEGLILLNKDKNILSANISATELLSTKRIDYNGKNILHLTRNSEIYMGVQKALEGDNTTILLQDDKNFCNIFASPVYTKKEITGVILLLLDVTKQQKAEAIRRDFAANVSHELRTPLTSITGYAELIESGMAKDEDVKSFANLIHRESLRLLTIIESIMRLSQIEEIKGTTKEPVELKSLCLRTVDNLVKEAEKRKITISIDEETQRKNIEIMANLTMMEELLYNLCENAIKYNREGGRVIVSLKEQKDKVYITVEDSGIGIPKEAQSRIFERFYRVDKSRSKETGGTGLGLSIVKHIVEYHEGQISLESQEDQGTKITVELPME